MNKLNKEANKQNAEIGEYNIFFKFSSQPFLMLYLRSFLETKTQHLAHCFRLLYGLKVKSLLWEFDMVCCLEEQLLNTFERADSETRPDNKGCTFCLSSLTVFI